MKVRPPKEDFEAARLVAYLESRGWAFTHVPLEVRSRRQGAKNKALGARKGFPDYVVVHPTAGVVFLELKRLRGGRVSLEQRDWIEKLTAAGSKAAVCNGFVNAKKWLEGL